MSIPQHINQHAIILRAELPTSGPDDNYRGKHEIARFAKGGAVIPYANVGDLQIYYETHGKGEPLLLIAGLGNDLNCWAFQVPELSKRYQLIVFDNRGSGRTIAPSTRYSISIMADDTAGLMNALGIDQAHILGVSMGGYIAQELAIRYPHRTRSLILMSTSIGPYLLKTSILRSWATAKLAGVDPKSLFLIMLPFLFNDSSFEDPQIVEMAVDAIAGHSALPRDVLYNQIIACGEHDVRGRINQITIPVLVLAGREDPFVPRALYEELASSIPNAELRILDGGGHVLNGAMADSFNRAVIDFLERCRSACHSKSIG